MKSFKQYITEASFGHTLWIDPKGKVYDMNSRKEITHPKGHPYTHYDWVSEEDCGYDGTNEAKTAAWSRKAGKNPEGGLNAKGRASYERENPGSDLKPPVSRETAAKSPKSAARRKSFCARMGGMPGAMKGDDGKPTRKALALRKWDC